MKPFTLPFLCVFLLAGCGSGEKAGEKSGGPTPPGLGSLSDARKGFVPKLARRRERGGPPALAPPAGIFRVVHYDAPLGKNSAYLTPDPKDGMKRPAVIWITGGDCNSIDDGCWHEGPPQNDQSATPIRRAGIVMMFPSLRGGNDSPGEKEGFLGEVDDVVAAADFLAKQDYVDPKRIYVGGHSTGGTMALLVAEYSDRFRAVFSFGPTDDVNRYPGEFKVFDTTSRKDVELRSPIHWLGSIRSPTFVFEGAGEGGNVLALQSLARTSRNPKAHFFLVNGADHFSTLAPINRLIAAKILRDTGAECDIAFTEAELNGLFGK
ncbi:MAG: prolyl oligopeptidase family serine peptidase [Gemmataceae bacterium]